MTNKQKISILARFFFCWLLPRAVATALVAWVVYSTLEISLADCTQIGRNYWDGNLWCLIFRAFGIVA